MTQNQVVGYKLMAYVLLKAAFSCQTKKISLDSLSLVDQKPSLLFAYQFSSGMHDKGQLTFQQKRVMCCLHIISSKFWKTSKSASVFIFQKDVGSG